MERASLRCRREKLPRRRVRSKRTNGAAAHDAMRKMLHRKIIIAEVRALAVRK